MDLSFLRPEVTGLPGTIGMMSAPGQRRALIADLDELRSEHRCTVLVSLTGDQELYYLGITDLRERAVEYGIELIRFPIADFSTPDSLTDLAALVDRIVAIARGGGTVVIHCWAGLGRTGLVAAC